MSRVQKTPAEALFEDFLTSQRIPFEPIAEAGEPRPDYLVGSGTSWGPVIFEVKELTEDDDFKRGPLEVSRRKVGEHIRRKIVASKKQIQYGASQCTPIPSVLLIYNALDPVFHLFGTDDHDFRAAMHGDWTLFMERNTGKIVASGYGRNRSFREKHNTSFTALAHLRPVESTLTIRLFPNKHAKVPLPTDLPICFEIG